MADDPPLEELMERLHAGDGDAASLVFNRFSGPLTAMARSRLGERILQKIDPEDVIQSVFTNLFEQLALGKVHFDSWYEFWALLRLSTSRQCNRWLEHFTAGRRNVNLEVSLSDPEPRHSRQRYIPSREPAPNTEIMLKEILQNQLDALRGSRREVVLLYIDGRTPAEIGEHVSRSRRTVERILADFFQSTKAKIEQ